MTKMEDIMNKPIKKEPLLIKPCDPLQYKRLKEISFLIEDLLYLSSACKVAASSFDEYGSYSDYLKAKEWENRFKVAYDKLK